MGNKWNEVPLGEIMSVIKNSYKPNLSEVLPYIGLEHIEQETLRLSGIGVSSDVISNKYVFEPDDILFGKLRPYFRKVYKPNFRGICSTDIMVLRSKNNKLINQDFLFYTMASKRIIDIATASSKGTRMPRADWKQLEKVLIKLPTADEQQKIASILSAFDDKIELNNEMNKILDEMAQAIFKHWFIDFEFPNENGQPYKSSGGEFEESELGLIPKGWEVKKIGELLDFAIGGDWGKDKPNNDYNQRCLCIRGADFPPISGGNASEIPLRFIKKSSLNKRRLEHGDIVIEISGGTKGRPTGRTIFIHENLVDFNENPTVFSNFCRLMRANDILNSMILFLHLQYIYYKGDIGGYEIQSTGISNFQFKYFCENKVLAIPPLQIQKNFMNIIGPIFDKKYTFENYYLAQLRDTLLPKLISGEIRVV